MRVKILAFADFPSPYRVEVFKGLAKEYDMLVIFDKMSDQNRNAAWFCKDTGLNSISLLFEFFILNLSVTPSSDATPSTVNTTLISSFLNCSSVLGFLKSSAKIS